PANDSPHVSPPSIPALPAGAGRSRARPRPSLAPPAPRGARAGGLRRPAGRGPASFYAAHLKAIAEPGERQPVPPGEHPPVPPPAVDPRAVGAPQVQDEDPVAMRGQPAVPPRDPVRVDPGVAPVLAAHQQMVAVEHDLLGPVR